MTVRIRGIRCLLTVALLLLLGSTPAAALTFGFQSGEVRVTAFRADDPTTLLVDTVMPLDGQFVDFSPAPVGLPDLTITIPQNAFMLSAPFGGYDKIVVESVTLTPGVGYTTSGTQTGPFSFDVEGSPVTVSAVYSVMDSLLVNPDLSNVALPPFDTSFDGTVLTDLNLLQLNGFTLGVIPGTILPLPESTDLIVKGDISFFGIVPEPGTGMLLALGLGGMALARRRARD